MKDWTGNEQACFATLGARNYAKEEREENDFYATEPKAVELLLEQEEFSKNIWEPACGQGHISKVLEKHGYKVLSTDKYDRGYGKGDIDFFDTNTRGVDLIQIVDKFDFKDFDIVTNPPYRYAKEFVEHALKTVQEEHKVAMFLRIQFLESKSRKELFKVYPPKTIYVASERLACAKNGEFGEYSTRAMCFAWFVWVKGFKGEPTLKWIN